MGNELFRQTESTIFSPELSAAVVAQIITTEGKTAPQIRDMRAADRYFDGHNDIEKKTRVYYDRDRKAYDNPAASNARIKSNFLRTLVQQKQDYAFAKTFVLKLSTKEQQEIDIAEDQYGMAWKNFCDGQLFRLAYVLAGQAVNHGIAWCYVWIDADGGLRIKDMPADLTYPVWADRQHTELDRLVYNFMQTRYGGMTADSTEYAEYWSKNERVLFNVSKAWTAEADLTDGEGNALFSHMSGGQSWGRIPFVVFKATDDEKPLLNFIKDHIDAYDMLDSRSVDGLLDDLDPLLVLKGLSTRVKDIVEGRELAKLTRTISLDADGDARYIQAQTPIDAHERKKESLRRDIIKFGYGVDYEDTRFGGNPNQMVIRSLYQNLDTYTDGLERHFQDFIDSLKYFFDRWCEWAGICAFDIAQEYKVLVKLDRSMMVNESAQIEDTVRLQGTGISQRTLLEKNPAVQDVDLELSRIDEERRESERENQLFNFGGDDSDASDGGAADDDNGEKQGNRKE